MNPDVSLEDLKTRPIPQLIADPLLSDHGWMLEEIERLIVMADHLEDSSAAHELVPVGLGQLLRAIQANMSRHIDAEEHSIFPAVLAGNAGEIRGAIRDLEKDHQNMDQALARVRSLTTDLVEPDDASETWSALYAELREFEARILRHARIEDEILFPRVFFEHPGSPESRGGTR